jgi:hypothetical protein
MTMTTAERWISVVILVVGFGVALYFATGPHLHRRIANRLFVYRQRRRSGALSRGRRSHD